jgi:hypothetical protein
MNLITNDAIRQKIIKDFKTALELGNNLTLKLYHTGSAPAITDSILEPVSGLVLSKVVNSSEGNLNLLYAIKASTVGSRPDSPEFAIKVLLSGNIYYLVEDVGLVTDYRYNEMFINLLVENTTSSAIPYDTVVLVADLNFGSGATEYLLSVGNNARGDLPALSKREFRFKIPVGSVN